MKSAEEYTKDAVQVLAMMASELYEEDPSTSQAELDREALLLYEASVIHLAVTPDGEVTDLFGTAFRYSYEVESNQSFVTVRSAGSDRIFDTTDDLFYTQEASTDR